MSWSLVVIIQVVVSSLMTIFTRRLALIDRKAFYVIGAGMYLGVAVVGLCYSQVLGGGWPSLPHGSAWAFILIEGFCIPASWLLQYKIIKQLGASNGVIVANVNNIGAALMGIFFLGERLSPLFLAGSGFIIASVVLAYRVHPDTRTKIKSSLTSAALTVISMFALYAVGMFFEKRAVDLIGVWNYTSFGWGMQFIGALTLLMIFGQKELKHLKPVVVGRGLLLGLITSIAGGLYIYAISIGALSHTIIGVSGKAAITMVLAAWLLKERNDIGLRLTAFLLSILGLALIVL